MLIETRPHHEVMFGYVLITLLLVVGPLAYHSGADSRVDERSRERRFTG